MPLNDRLGPIRVERRDGPSRGRSAVTVNTVTWSRLLVVGAVDRHHRCTVTGTGQRGRPAVIDLDELVAFLEERLDDDEYRAKAARSESWTVEQDVSTTPGKVPAESRVVIGTDGERRNRPGERPRPCAPHRSSRSGARPARDRSQTIAFLARSRGSNAMPRRARWTPPEGADVTMVSVLEMLALPYADHADYRERVASVSRGCRRNRRAASTVIGRSRVRAQLRAQQGTGTNRLLGCRPGTELVGVAYYPEVFDPPACDVECVDRHGDAV